MHPAQMKKGGSAEGEHGELSAEVGGVDRRTLTDQVRGQFAPVIAPTVEVSLLHLAGRPQPCLVATTCVVKTVRPCDDQLEIFQITRWLPHLNRSYRFSERQLPFVRLARPGLAYVRASDYR